MKSIFKILVLLLTKLCIVQRVRSQVLDRSMLRVSETPGQFAFCLTNPLAGIPDTNWGIYEFWYQLNIDTYDGSDQEPINFMAPSPHPEFKIATQRRGYNCDYWETNWLGFKKKVKKTCYDSETSIIDGASTKYKFNGGYDWYMLYLGYQESTKKAQFRLFTWINSNFTLGQTQPHFPETCFMKTNLMSGSAFNRVREIKFWSLSASEYDSNFFERYHGRTFKHYTPFSLWLLGSYVAQPSGTGDVWTNQINPTQDMASMQASAIKWEDHDNDDFTFCSPTYRYVWIFSNPCIACTSPCKECSYMNETRCITCVQGYFPMNYQCFPVDCPKGQFFNETSNTCVDCISPCSSCLNETACTYCVSGFNYVDDFSYQCLDNTLACPAGTFLDSEGYPVCRSCPKGCSVCSDQSTCTTCLQDLFLENGQCVTNCGSLNYANLVTNQCVTCPQSNCEVCKQSECGRCSSGYFYNGTDCVTDCGTGKYANSDSRQCMICQPDCTACQGNNYTCSACNTGTFLLGTSCVPKCPYVGFYQNAATKTCDPCNPSCQICVSSTTDCISCQPTALYSNRACLASCPSEQFTSVDGNCYPCDPACQVCTGSLNSECSVCKTGFYLMGTTCEPTCPEPYYANTTLLECKECKYYCNGCTTRDNCYACKPGYPALPGSNCTGGYYLRTDSTFNLQLPMNTTVVNASYDPDEITVEIWFKADDILSANSEIIVGMSPYKIRKRPGQPQIQIYYQGLLTYCDTGTLLSDVWYNFAFAIKEPSNLTCFLNGVQISSGQNPAVLITQNVTSPTELTLGGTQVPSLGEVNFVGRLKEFRWWKNARSTFDLIGFRSISFEYAHPNLIAYWRLDELNDGTVTLFTDSAGAGTLTYNPTTGTPSTTVQMAMDFREQYLKICPEGQYSYFDSNLGYQLCLNCNPLCKNCIGPSTNDCVECYSPFRLIQEEKTCINLETCPDGFYEDPESSLCFRCFAFCELCVNSATMCTKCKDGYFREYQGTSCVDNCPLGMYGNYAKKLCYTRPSVDYVIPDNGLIINYGDFIDASADYTVYNNEPRNTYTYGWKIIRLDGNIDISEDVVKTYYQTDVLRVHFDNNVLQANQEYNVTFYLKGSDDFYKDMYAEQTNKIYLGIKPQNGRCQATPLYGIANVTNFNFTQSGWEDKEIITRYDFFYSMDGGNIYIPLESSNLSLTTFQYTFQHIYFSMPSVRIKCKATNIKGFYNQAVTIIALEPRSNADASLDLERIQLETPSTEAECLKMVHQLKLISQNIGFLKEQDAYSFDPKISASECNKQLCYSNGECQFLSFIKKYYCKCDTGYAGQNCTFSNNTQLDLIKTKTQQISIVYNSILNKLYEFEYLKLQTSYKEHLNDISYAQAVSLVRSKIQQWNGLPQSEEDLQNYLVIISNLLEYVEFDIIENNRTGSWNNNSVKIQTVKENIDYALELFEAVRLNSLTQISMLSPQMQITSRMLAFRHQLISQSSVVILDASNHTKRNQRTMIKIAETNFINQSLPLQQEFITEAIEYALNPYQLINQQNISNNVFEVNFYNLSTRNKVMVSGLQNGFEISFPLQDNQNLTSFVQDYNTLSPYKAVQLSRRNIMVQKSELACRYWTGLEWDKSGCQFVGFDKTHLKCQCNHLTAFSPTFITPPVQVEASVLPDKYVKPDNEDAGEIVLDDLLVPFDQYFKNLAELLQHKQPKPLSFMLKPGLYIVILFWFMYCTSLVYYSGKDRLRRFKMTKAQNRDDLAEIKNDQIQSLDDVIKDLIVRDYKAQAEKCMDPSNLKPMKIYDEMNYVEKKILKKRARRKVFGRVGTLWERAKRYYKRTLKRDSHTSETKMKFFYEALKTNMWFGLMARTSKIAPRHVRLTMMYLYLSVHLSFTTIAYMFGYHIYIKEALEMDLAVVGGQAIVPLIMGWVFGIPIALIFRMPYSTREKIQGVRAKKVNLAFQEIDQEMGCRYAIGYFFCLLSYLIMTMLVLFFSYFYPHDYCMNWLMIIIMMAILDLLIFTFAFAGMQLLLVLLSEKAKCFYNFWAFFEVIRYVKNLKG